MANKNFLNLPGTIMRSLGNNVFEVELKDSKKNVLATIAARLRTIEKRKIKLTQGDLVLLEIPPDDLTRGRIIKLIN